MAAAGKDEGFVWELIPRSRHFVHAHKSNPTDSRYRKAVYIPPFTTIHPSFHIFVDIWSSDDVMEGDLEEELEVKLLVPE